MKIDTRETDLSSLPQVGSTSAGRPAIAWLGKQWLRLLVLALAGFAVHAPALQGQLIWDDQYLARDNPFIKSPWLALEAFRHHLFLDSFSIHYRPVQNLSLMFDYAFWNTNMFGFHLTNVLLHVASGLLLYLLLRKILPGLLSLPAASSTFVRRIDLSLVAFFAAAIWMVHPVHSAAVDYISGRADSLAFAFACGGWLLFLKAREQRGGFGQFACFSLAAGAGLFALCSRESAAIWFAVFLLHLFVFQPGQSRRQKLCVLISCLALLAVYTGLRHLPEQRPTRGPSGSWSAPVRVMLMMRALGDYGRLLLCPTNLHMERTVFSPGMTQNLRERVAASSLEYLSIGGLAFGTGLVALCFWRRPGQRIRVFGAAWFIFAFLPISNLVDLNATAAEHWLYLPSAGFFIFLAGCVVDLPKRILSGATAAAVLALVLLGARSFARSSDWLDAETFYTRTAAAGGTSCRVSVNLAQIYLAHGDYKKARTLLEDVLRIQPDYTIARNNLADALSREGKSAEAEKVLQDATKGAGESRKDYPRTWVAALNLAHMVHEQNKHAEAIDVLKKAIQDYPSTWELIAAESELLRESGELETAASLVRPFAEQHWWHYASWMALGRVEAEEGNIAPAESALRHASWLDIRSTDSLNLMALMHLRQNRLVEACQVQRRAVARQPDEPRQYVLLSNILDKMGRPDEARAALGRVSELRAVAATARAAN